MRPEGAGVESLLHLLFQIEVIESELRSIQGDGAQEKQSELDLLLDQLPQPIRDQYRWLRTWTFYPIARLRNRACTGCGGTYPISHAFVVESESRVTYCEHCLRILLLRDLALVA